jgi:hypothetical protein
VSDADKPLKPGDPHPLILMNWLIAALWSGKQ